MNGYYSIAGNGEGRYEIKKSVFLAFASPVSSEEEAVAFINRKKAAYPDARHHVYAYCLRSDNKSRYTDDGEPSGTAGMPVLDSIRHNDLTDCVVVVIRYFGGVLLGTGGLVRAYTEAAKLAIDAGKIVFYRPLSVMRLFCEYNDHDRIMRILNGTATIRSSVFLDRVQTVFSLPVEETERFVNAISEQTSGRVICEKVSEEFGI